MCYTYLLQAAFSHVFVYIIRHDLGSKRKDREASWRKVVCEKWGWKRMNGKDGNRDGDTM